jgi:hypothetical protein
MLSTLKNFCAGNMTEKIA